MAGFGLAALLAPALRSLLAGIEPLDAVTFGTVGSVVGAVAFLTVWMPARRAATANPADVLRAE